MVVSWPSALAALRKRGQVGLRRKRGQVEASSATTDTDAANAFCDRHFVSPWTWAVLDPAGDREAASALVRPDDSLHDILPAKPCPVCDFCHTRGILRSRLPANGRPTFMTIVTVPLSGDGSRDGPMAAVVSLEPFQTDAIIS